MKIYRNHLLLLAALFVFIGGRARAAELKLAAVLSDHMVLQRDKPVPIWGWADAGEEVTVDFGGQKKTAKADAAGKWQVQLDPMAASAQARVLLVQSEKPERKTQVADVLVGEVWLGSGQSNMAMPVKNAKNYDKEQAAATQPLIRMFKESSKTAATAQADSSGNWTVCAPDTVGGFSATLFFFGRELQRELKVPVGLINSSVGGTPIEAWIAAGAQAQVPELKNFIAAQNGGPATARKSDFGGLFNGKIAPLVPYALRGAVWYQGEANTHPGKSQFYQYHLPLLVNDWRKLWGEELPFAWVQLPNYNREGQGWPLVCEAMLKTLRLPQTGMAITVDIGEAANIHPKNKQEVGRRLSLWALGTVYGQKVPAICGPLPVGHEIKGDKIIVAFKHTEGGLVATKGGLVATEGELQGFVVAGEDKQWKPAQAKIDGDKVIVASAEVAKPVALRYAWAANPVCNLFNGAGLPASPFRTDAWPVSDTK